MKQLKKQLIKTTQPKKTTTEQTNLEVNSIFIDIYLLI
jgi:hypothetical protein